MIYRVTYSTSAGATRVVCTDANEALATAREAAAAGGQDVRIGTAEGVLFMLGEFQRFLGQG